MKGKSFFRLNRFFVPAHFISRSQQDGGLADLDHYRYVLLCSIFDLEAWKWDFSCGSLLLLLPLCVLSLFFIIIGASLVLYHQVKKVLASGLILHFCGDRIDEHENKELRWNRAFLGRDSPEKQRGRDALMQQEWKQYVHAVQTATTQTFEWNITTNVLFLCSEWGNYEFRTSGCSCDGPEFHLKEWRTMGITQRWLDIVSCCLMTQVLMKTLTQLQTQVFARGAVGKENKPPSNYILIPSLTSSRSPSWQVPPQHHSEHHHCSSSYMSKPFQSGLQTSNICPLSWPLRYFQEPQHLHLGHLWQLSASKPRSTTGRIMTTINSPSSHLTRFSPLFQHMVLAYWLSRSTKNPFLLHLMPITSLFHLDPSLWGCFSQYCLHLFLFLFVFIFRLRENGPYGRDVQT